MPLPLSHHPSGALLAVSNHVVHVWLSPCRCCLFVMEMEEEQEDQPAEVEGEPVCKRYRRYHNIEFHEKLLVSVMINVKSFGRKDMPYVKWLIWAEWHAQIQDQKMHPRPRGFELFTPTQTFTCFQNMSEWTSCTNVAMGRGNQSATGESPAPAMTAHCQDWANGKFNKWLVLCREMQNDITPSYVNAFLL